MGGWNKGKTFADWNAKVKDKFGDSFRFLSVGEPNSRGERLVFVECLSCGTVKEVNSISFRGRCKTQGHCDKCFPHYLTPGQREKMKRQKVAKQIKRQDETIKKEKKEIGKKLKANQIGLRFYKECNLAIIPTNKTYCDNCLTEHHRANARKGWRQKDINRRTRAKQGRRDKDITLEKLYERDNGICYLCGRVCDWKDYEIKQGAFVVGRSYPSIEHVTALCNGGLHTWDNVKLACFECNSVKGRKILAS